MAHGKKFHYTKKGKADAKKEAEKSGGEPSARHKMPTAPKKGFAVVKPMGARGNKKAKKGY